MQNNTTQFGAEKTSPYHLHTYKIYYGVSILIKNKNYISFTSVLLLSYFCLFIFSGSAHAFRVDPMKMTFKKVGDRKALRIENKLKEPITIEVEIYEGKALSKDPKKK